MAAILGALPIGVALDAADRTIIDFEFGAVRQWARRGSRPRQPADSATKTPICSAQSVRRAA
jgi:hypothetical protein